MSTDSIHTAFAELVNHLQTVAGKNEGFYRLPPEGTQWTLLAPTDSVKTALQRAVKVSNTHVGVIMPYQDSKEEDTRGLGTDPLYRTAQQIRRVDFYTTVFIRSGNQWVLNGQFMRLPSWLQAIFNSFMDSGNHGLNTFSIGSVQYMGMSPDYLILQATCSVKYITDMEEIDPSMRGPTLSKISFFEGHHQFGVENREPWFSVFLNE